MALSPQARRDTALLFGSVASFFLSVSMLVPTLPLYVRSLGGSPVQIGLVVGSFSVGVLVVRPWVGHAVDSRGRRPILLLGGLLVVAMSPLYIWFTALAAMIAVRIVHGIGLSAFTSGSTTLVADLSPAGRRTEFLSYLSIAGILAFALGPVAGIEIAERWGFRALFLAVTVCAMASLACGAGLSRWPRPPTRTSRADYRRALVRRDVLVPTATLLMVTLAHGGLFAFVPILLEARLSFDFGLFFVAYAAASLIVRLVVGRIARLWGDGPLVWAGLALYGTGLALVPFVHDTFSMILPAALLGVGFGAYQPAVYGIVANAASDQTRGMVLSMFLAAFDAGMSLGGLVSGPVVAAYGIPALLHGLAVVPVAAAAVFVVGLGWTPAPCPPAATGEARVAT
ncbi:MAG TPA: MFS transporter [Gemmatimonadota bacterium]|nr:MFS transporter [Gemmatimonadota bacterium]